MPLITQHGASKLEGAPSKPYLSKMSKKIPRPLYFVDHEGKIKVDTDHFEWVSMLLARTSSTIAGFTNGLSMKKNLDNIVKPPVKKAPVKKIVKPKKKPVAKKKNEPKKSPAPKKEPETPPAPVIIHKAKKPAKGSIEELAEEAARARLEQEILKAKLLEYKTEQEQLKLMKESGGLIEYALADFLFIGFMELTNSQILSLLKKIEPVIVNMCIENNPKGILKRLTRDLESIIRDTKDNQAEAVKKWRTEEL